MTAMVDAAAILEQLGSETEAMVVETEQLARIDSGSDDPAGVGRVCELTGELLVRAGWTAQPRPEGGLTAELTMGSGPRLLLVGHADTVWPVGTVRSWSPHRDAKTLTGPGVGDMKASLVMAAHALALARRAGLEGVGAIEVLVVADEERGSVSSRGWIEQRARGAGACLGLEAGWPGGGVVVARGAVGALGLEAFGQTAHCAGHEGRGASAVAALAPLVTELECLSRPDKGVLISVGVFRGGVARQVVPDRAELAIDLRAPTADAAEALLSKVRDIVARAGGGEVRGVAGGGGGDDGGGDGDGGDGDGDDVRLVLTGGITRPAFGPEASRMLWELHRDRAAALGIPLVPVTSRGGSDASFAAALGVPTLDGLGPICHDSCARGERIEVASLAQRGALMALLILDLAAGWRAPSPSTHP